MKKLSAWRGIRMRRVTIGADPDSEARTVALPASWDDDAAAALAAIMPGGFPVALDAAAEAWILPRAGKDAALAQALRQLLRLRRGAPGASIWAGERTQAPIFFLNLAAFHDPASGFDSAGYIAAIEAVLAGFADSAAGPLAVSLTGLAELIASLGLDYDSGQARELARCLALALRAMAEPGFVTAARGNAIPGLVDAARQAAARRAAQEPRAHAALTAIQTPDVVEALLGVETSGIAPAFAPVTADGTLTRIARAALAARGMSMTAALAALYSGHDPLPVPSVAAHLAMHEALAPLLHQLPARPEVFAAPRAIARHEELPAWRNGYTQKISLGGHRLFLRTGDYADGRLGEFHVTLPRETTATRTLMDSLAIAISLGLQHGVPLRAYIDQLLNTGFAPAGAVEGDSAIAEAASPLDYVLRHLAANYLGLRDLPAMAPESAPAPTAESAPLLPLDLPSERVATRRRLRLVSDRKAV